MLIAREVHSIAGSSANTNPEGSDKQSQQQPQPNLPQTGQQSQIPQHQVHGKICRVYLLKMDVSLLGTVILLPLSA